MGLPVRQEGPLSDPTLFRAPLAEQKLVPGIARRTVQDVSYKQTDSDKVDDMLHSITHAQKCHLQAFP